MPGLSDHREPGQADGLQREAGGHQRALADPVGQRTGDRGDGHERRRPRQQPQARAERPVVEPCLQELGEEEDAGEQRGEGQEDGAVAGRERSRPEERHRQHRLAHPQLPGDEGREQQRPRRSTLPTTSNEPQPAWLPRTSPQTTPKAPPDTRARPPRSSADVGAVALLDPGQHQRDGDQPDRDVHPEDPLPADPLDDRAADQRAAGHREAGDRAEDPDRGAPLLGGEGRAEQREPQRDDQRRTGALDGPSGDQPRRRPGPARRPPTRP